MKNVIIILFFAVAFSSCNTSYSGDTTCTVKMYNQNDFQKETEVSVRKGMVSELTEGQDVWTLQYYNGLGKASEPRVIKNNKYGTDTLVVAERHPEGDKILIYRKAKLVKL